MANLNRRAFLGSVGGCAGHILWMSAGYGAARRLFAAVPAGRVVAQEIWGRLEQVGPGIWAMISTPLAGTRDSGAMRTVCNGGIVAGRNQVLLIEAFATPEGAQWMAQMARQLTGKRPTLALVTHFHGDHTGGMPGYSSEGETIPVRSTAKTRELLQGKPSLPEPIIPEDAGSEIDLGGRVVRIAPRVGHTPSDVTVETGDRRVVFCGDLVWNGMFPNYRDAIPSKKAESVRALVAAGQATYVPGHGALARRSDLERYLTLLADVEEKARAAIAAGVPLDQAADAYRLPSGYAEWVMFSPTYFRVAFQAWGRELGAK